MQLKSAFIGLVLGLMQTTSNPVHFKVPGLEVTPANTIELPITIETNGNTLGSMEFELLYDQKILEFSQINVSQKAQQWLTYTMDTGNGRVRWGGYDQTHGKYAIDAPTEIFRLTFKVLDINWKTTPITIGRKRAGDKLGWDVVVQNTNGYLNLVASRSNVGLPPIGPSNAEGKVFPVPSKDFVTMVFKVPQTGRYSLKTYSASGNLIRMRDVDLREGEVTLVENLHSLPEGFYLLNIASNTFARTFKIIKN